MPIRFVLRQLGRALELAVLSRPATVKRELLLKLAAELGVQDFACDGPLGVFEGSASDRWIFLNYFRERSWAPEVQAFLRKAFAEDSGTLIDVGANIGLTCIPIAKERGVRCYAFEPNPKSFAFLAHNVVTNDVCDRIQTFNLALAAERGVIDLELSPDNPGDHRLRLGTPRVSDLMSEASRPTVRVRVQRLDESLAGAEMLPPIVLKTDTQGADAAVLQGAGDLLDRIDYVIVEYFPYALRRLGSSAGELRSSALRFPFGAVLCDDSPRLLPIEEALAEMQRAVPDDADPATQSDLLLARRRT